CARKRSRRVTFFFAAYSSSEKLDCMGRISRLLKLGLLSQTVAGWARDAMEIISVSLGGTLEITPNSGTSRSTDRSHIQALLNRLDETGSFQPGRYVDLTFNSSYILALVKLWQTKRP
ncbi:MAG: hypothetical protein KDA57_20160, partial [Planctomycetales bacterium]|nr:hypothetical protein [Planctomycetales bacterium]